MEYCFALKICHSALALGLAVVSRCPPQRACEVDCGSFVVGAASGCETGSRASGSSLTALVSDRLSLESGQDVADVTRDRVTMAVFDSPFRGSGDIHGAAVWRWIV